MNYMKVTKVCLQILEEPDHPRALWDMPISLLGKGYRNGRHMYVSHGKTLYPVVHVAQIPVLHAVKNIDW